MYQHGNSNPKRLCHLASFCLRQLGNQWWIVSNFQSLPLLVVPTLTGEVAELEFDFGPSPSIAATSKIVVSSGPTKESAHTGTQTRRAGRGSRGCSLVSGVSWWHEDILDDNPLEYEILNWSFNCPFLQNHNLLYTRIDVSVRTWTYSDAHRKKCKNSKVNDFISFAHSNCWRCTQHQGRTSTCRDFFDTHTCLLSMTQVHETH